MDLVDYDQATYERIKSDYKTFASKLRVKDVTFIPISALHGDNIVNAGLKNDMVQWHPDVSFRECTPLQ